MGNLIEGTFFVMLLVVLAWLTFTVVEFVVARAVRFVTNSIAGRNVPKPLGPNSATKRSLDAPKKGYRITLGKAIAFQCPACRSPLRSDLDDAGSSFCCPTCKHNGIVPGREEAVRINAQRGKDRKEAGSRGFSLVRVCDFVVNRLVSKPRWLLPSGMRKYIVTGTNHESGEDISIEVIARDWKDAEERACRQGMLVSRVQVASDPYPIEGGTVPEATPNPPPPSSPMLLRHRPGSSQPPPSRAPGGGICAGNALPLYLGARLTQKLWP